MEATDQKIIEGMNFSATNVGNITELQGKVFLKESIGSTGTEISITSLAPRTKIPLLHFHKKKPLTMMGGWSGSRSGGQSR